MVGAGEVGSYVADRLSREGHDVSVVDVDLNRVRAVGAQFDVLAVAGSGTHPSVLAEAGLEDCELVVSVTSSDEVNMMTSLIAKQQGVKSTIVRIESSELRSRAAAKVRDAFGADLVIDPDSETAERILNLLDYPGASEINIMAHGEAIVIGARLSDKSPLVGRTLSDLATDFEPDWDFIVGSISRGPETIIPRDKQTTLLKGDLVRVACKRQFRRRMTKLLGLSKMSTRRILLLGGGRTAELLARRLAGRGTDVQIVERDPLRAQQLAEQLHDALIMQGEITDADLLEEAELGTFDVVAALTGEDESNILACLYAKAAGVRETIAVVHKLALLPLLRSAGVDVAMSPRTSTANGVLRFVRGDVAAVATFLQTEAEVLELEVADDSPADGATVKELHLPKDVLIGAIVRDGKTRIARGNSRLRGRDHVVAFAMPESVDEVNRKLTCGV